MTYYFILGRENKISQKEVEAVLASFGVGFGFCHCESASGGRGNPSEKIAHMVTCRKTSSQAPRNDPVIIILSDHLLEIKLDYSPEKVAELMNILGGTIKIYKKIASSNEKIADLLLKENISKKFIFGLSNYSTGHIETFKLALSAKKMIKQPVRVIAGKDNDQLSSAQSFQYEMDRENIEYGLFDTGVGKLIAVQDINEWTRHDFGKPRSDARSGMLPPKLARAMVNIALGQIRPISPIRPICVDPFCGSGNILIEALSLGLDVIGSDNSERAVGDTKANADWLMQNSKIKDQNVKCKIFKQDATKYDFSKIDRDFIVVTEPYLGRPRNSKLRIEEEKEVKEDIRRLYEDFLKNLLATGDRLLVICIVFPLFELANGKKLSIFTECLDFISEIGYDIICPPCSGETSSCKAGPPMEYGRDYQVVKREIVLLKL